MKQLLLVTLFAALASAQQPDITPIRSLIDRINTARKSAGANDFARLFTADGSLRFGTALVFTGREAIEKISSDQRIWSEVTPPVIQDERVSFPSPDVALVDAVEVQIGSVTLKRATPVLLVLKREAGEWRIFSMRSLPPLGMIHRTEASR